MVRMLYIDKKGNTITKVAGRIISRIQVNFYNRNHSSKACPSNPPELEQEAYMHKEMRFIVNPPSKKSFNHFLLTSVWFSVQFD